MRPQQTTGTPPTTQAETKPDAKAKTLSPAVVLGRAIQKLCDLDIEETEALAKSPSKIKDEFAKKRAAVLESLTESQRKSAVAAVAANRPEEEAAE
jgi:hypothetical protein